jgi:hypothetical protein
MDTARLSCVNHAPTPHRPSGPWVAVGQATRDWAWPASLGRNLSVMCQCQQRTLEIGLNVPARCSFWQVCTIYFAKSPFFSGGRPPSTGACVALPVGGSGPEEPEPERSCRRSSGGHGVGPLSGAQPQPLGRRAGMGSKEVHSGGGGRRLETEPKRTAANPNRRKPFRFIFERQTARPWARPRPIARALVRYFLGLCLSLCPTTRVGPGGWPPALIAPVAGETDRLTNVILSRKPGAFRIAN